MTIKQLSVFLENKTGRINEVAKILAKHGINMHAFSMAESTDFGILRLIVSEVDRAVEVLRARDFAVMLTDVVCISCPPMWQVRCLPYWSSLPTSRYSSNTCMPSRRATRRMW